METSECTTLRQRGLEFASRVYAWVGAFACRVERYVVQTSPVRCQIAEKGRRRTARACEWHSEGQSCIISLARPTPRTQERKVHGLNLGTSDTLGFPAHDRPNLSFLARPFQPVRTVQLASRTGTNKLDMRLFHSSTLSPLAFGSSDGASSAKKDWPTQLARERSEADQEDAETNRRHDQLIARQTLANRDGADRSALRARSAAHRRYRCRRAELGFRRLVLVRLDLRLLEALGELGRRRRGLDGRRQREASLEQLRQSAEGVSSRPASFHFATKGPIVVPNARNLECEPHRAAPRRTASYETGSRPTARRRGPSAIAERTRPRAGSAQHWRPSLSQYVSLSRPGSRLTRIGRAAYDRE